MAGASIVVIMGPAGSGKTTVGRLLATACDRPFFDADDYHTHEHVRRMQAGQPLTDHDRAPWLERLRQLLEQQLLDGAQPVLACSALKPAYRQALRPLTVDADPPAFVHLQVSPAELQRRLQQRRGHFAAETLLDSQLRTLEFAADESGLFVINGEKSPQQIVADIRARLQV